MLQLYGYGRSRWVRPLWMLRELAVDFEAIEVDRAAGDLDTAAFRALNPTGKVPVLVDGGVAIHESGAILQYLGDRFGRLIPPAGTPARGQHDAWMFQVATELEQPLWQLHRQINKGQGPPDLVALEEGRFALAAAPFEARLAQAAHLCGDAFTAADIMFAHLLTWQVAQPLLPAFPALCAYRDRLMARPAYPHWLYTDFVGQR